MVMRFNRSVRFRCSHRDDARSRKGFTIVELIAAMILLGVVLTVSVSILAVVARERRGTEQRQFAMQHAANLLERTVALGWNHLSPGLQALDQIPPELRSLLPNLESRIEVTELPHDFHSKLVTVSLTWKNREGQKNAPVHLSAWVYPLQEGS